MAIVINGSGTVTGLAVGGLPDGTVDAGTLATDSVTAAKIAANSIDSAELIDGAVDDSHIGALAASKLTGALPAISGASLTGFTNAQMPTGSVLQVTNTTSSISGAIATTSTSFTNTGLGTGTITPTATGSKFYITMSGFIPHVNPNNLNYGGQWKMYRSIAGGSYAGVTSQTCDGGMYQTSGISVPWHEQNGYCSVFDTPSYTSGQQLNYRLYFKETTSNQNGFYIHHQGGALQGSGSIACTITIMEIAG